MCGTNKQTQTNKHHFGSTRLEQKLYRLLRPTKMETRLRPRLGILILVIGVSMPVLPSVVVAFLKSSSRCRCCRRHPFANRLEHRGRGTTTTSRRFAAAAIVNVQDDNDDDDDDDYFDDTLSDTLETLSEKLSNLLSKKTQRQVLTSRLAVDNLAIFRTHVRNSTIPSAGIGLFANDNYPKGTLLTCYPGDALVVDPDYNNNHGREVLWGAHIVDIDHQQLRQEYMLRAIRNDWGIVAIPALFGREDTNYLGHYANDGATQPPRNERELATYVIESANKANAEHKPCMDCHMVTVATRDIAKGEEIFVTYGPEYWRESFVCGDNEYENEMQDDKASGDDDDDEYDEKILCFDLEDGIDDVLDDEFDDFEFDGADCYEEVTDSIVADIVSSLEDPPESPTRGKGFG